MATPKSYQFDLPSGGKPTDVSLNEIWYPGIQRFWSRCTSSRIPDAILGIKAVVIHATAGSSSAGAVSVMRDGHASFHWLVPDEDEPQHGDLVWACAPEARAAWHVRNSCSHPSVNNGQNKVNHWSLGIEVVNSQQSSDQFSNWQVEATAQIVRYCWAKYPNLKHIVSHARLDPSRRSDPGVNFPWDQFKALVLSGSNDNIPKSVSMAINANKIDQNISPTGCCTI